MEDDIIFFLIEDELFFFKWKTTQFFDQMEDDLNILLNGRRPPKFITNNANLHKQNMICMQF